jgi:hypothetical protein
LGDSASAEKQKYPLLEKIPEQSFGSLQSLSVTDDRENNIIKEYKRLLLIDNQKYHYHKIRYFPIGKDFLMRRSGPGMEGIRSGN